MYDWVSRQNPSTNVTVYTPTIALAPILYVTGNNQDFPFKDCFKLKSHNIVVMYNSLRKYVQNYTIHAHPSIFLSPGLCIYLCIIVFIWSQLDGGKVEQRPMAKVPSKPYDAKAK